MVTTRLGWLALPIGAGLLVVVLAPDRVFEFVAWLGAIVLLGAVPVTELRRRKLGAVLVRFPRTPSQKVFGGVGVMQLLAAWFTFTPRAPMVAVLAGCTGLFFVTCAVRRYEFRERGIATMESAWPWTQVVHYSWAGAGRDQLHLQLYWTWWFSSSGVLPVPAGQREAVDGVLRKHAPGSGVPAAGTTV
jgi:hypothetical protein